MKASRMDPFSWFLNGILRGFLTANLKDFELQFVQDNIQKHRKALWLNALASVLVFFALRDTPHDAIGTVINATLAPAMIFGGAWFAVSFGGVPKKLINIAMSTTLWMFIAFLVSLSAMFIAVGFVTSPFLWPVLGLIYAAGVMACIQYDTADGLKSGLDEAMLNHSRAALLWYSTKQGITPPEE
jgi:hypothetical protein